MKISGNIVDVKNRETFAGTLYIENGKIQKIERTNETYSQYILPGFINAHVHIESSMLAPASFAHIAVKHGTVATVSDPHEIANVLGIEGIDYMIDSAAKTPLKIFFGAPSCVPATSFETAGANINADDIEKLMQRDDIWYLSEMMNFPGVIFQDKEVHQKLQNAQKQQKPIDGHAPFLVGDDLKKYADAGITTDHECVTIEEAKEKIGLGIKVQIREGSAAKNFEALHPLLAEHSDMLMLCTDDSHPNDLQKGFINTLVKRAIAYGYDLYDVLSTVSTNIVSHYHLPVGLLQEGDSADFIISKDLKDFEISATYINGECVFDGKETLFSIPQAAPINNFKRTKIKAEDIAFPLQKENNIKIIKAIDGDLTTDKLSYQIKEDTANFESELNEDILKIVVLSRYDNNPVQIAYINGFGMQSGAFASSIAHDSHNIIAVGTNDADLLAAINLLIENKGGIAYANASDKESLPLEIAGLMTTQSVEYVAEAYESISDKIKESGSKLKAPLMTAAFMSLLVIPKLKLGDKGLFDVEKFAFTNLID